MKTSSFVLLLPEPHPNPQSLEDLRIKIPLPTLSAYAIESAEFYAPQNFEGSYSQLIEGKDFELENDQVVWTSGGLQNISLASFGTCRLVIHYHGIRDYTALFPFVNCESLKARLAKYYEESEQAFESGAWLSYALMCGALYEGMLFSVIESKSLPFAKLISKAEELKLVGSPEIKIMNLARESRNLVHASNHGNSYVSRTNAMDMRTTMDKVIYSFAQHFIAKQE